MPTIMREGPYRFFFYSDEGDPREPPHIHAASAGKVAKFWLDPVEFASSNRLRAHEIRDLGKLVERHRNMFLEAWRAHFDS